ncbi:hypothetical protein O3G_MSEX001606 [Manduca sexta]|uniref:Uncharacterized protein n=2 Tax=Manduca sexta TaxID=7130 RepID=A0A921YKR7_MANSE|nr:hypothetical protein O3G_MSEX001606 [Manduca sexta]
MKSAVKLRCSWSPSGEMVRWRFSLFLAMLVLLPARTGSKLDDDEDEERTEETEEDDEDDEEDEEEETESKEQSPGRRAPALIPTPKPLTQATRTSKKRPLECYVCAYKADTPLRSCLDPSKFRVHTITCHSMEDKCFTSVISKGNTYEAVIRGCRSGCVGSPETTCCELNRCNNQAFAMPIMAPRVQTTSKSDKSIPPSVVFFVTILLVLQTVVKVAFV